MITENLSTLKINKLSQEQYDKALKEGKINPNEIYLTPDEPLIKRVTLTDTTTEALLLEDNTVYNGEGNPINNLSIDYPTTEFMCELIFTVGSEFEYYFPLGTRYIGKAPDFKNGETWELSIHNGIVASGKVVSE